MYYVYIYIYINYMYIICVCIAGCDVNKYAYTCIVVYMHPLIHLMDPVIIASWWMSNTGTQVCVYTILITLW